MRKIYFTSVLSFLSVCLFSQQGPLLQKFKYRINTYRAINYSIAGSSNINRSELATGVHTNNYSSAALGATYYTITSTDRILLSTSGSLFSSYNGSKAVNTSENDKSSSFMVVPSFNVSNQWFAKNIFTELGATVSSNFNFDKNTLTGYPGPLKNKRADYQVAINTGIGKGRLENITDMQNALWLYKELDEAKIISRQLSDDELNELGQTITKGNNTRVLDGRKRTQFILKTVDNYFQQKALVSHTDINYFVHLNDILFFAVNNPRLAGTEKFLRLTPAIYGSNWDVTQYNIVDKFEQRSDTWSVILRSGINKYKPLNLVHQENYGASVKLAYISKRFTQRFLTTDTVTNETHSNTALKQAGLNGFFQHAIYPNTRTVISFNFQTEGGYQDFASESNFYGSVQLSGVFNYFISYKTRLNCTVGGYYQKNMYYDNINYYEIPGNLQLYANLGLDISL